MMINLMIMVEGKEGGVCMGMATVGCGDQWASATKEEEEKGAMICDGAVICDGE